MQIIPQSLRRRRIIKQKHVCGNVWAVRRNADGPGTRWRTQHITPGQLQNGLSSLVIEKRFDASEKLVLTEKKKN